MKKYGYDCVLYPLLQDVKTLEQNRIFVPLLGKCVKGTIQLVAADNLGAHSIAGFNESFTGKHLLILHSNTSRDPNKRREIRFI